MTEDRKFYDFDNDTLEVCFSGNDVWLMSRGTDGECYLYFRREVAREIAAHILRGIDDKD